MQTTTTSRIIADLATSVKTKAGALQSAIENRGRVSMSGVQFNLGLTELAQFCSDISTMQVALADAMRDIDERLTIIEQGNVSSDDAFVRPIDPTDSE